MAWWRWLLISVGAVATAAIMVVTGFFAESKITTTVRQDGLQDFYAAPNPLNASAGTLLRIEPLGVDVPEGTGYRILYVTERPWGEPAVSGGMVFIPDAAAPADGRPVVAWAHGTLGQGDACAPSRSTNPLGDMTGWLAQMMQAGWVVAATDYAGLGTEGPNLYLVGEAEVRDVVNAVRAAQQVPDAQAGARYVVWGHSQGGHSTLWAGHLAPELAPELSLLGVAAAAPAAELVDIMDAQWDTAIGWVIGPEAIRSWPVVDPQLDPAAVLSPAGARRTDALAEECIIAAALDGQALQGASGNYFALNPIDVPAWKAMAARETPPALPAAMPVFIGQSISDAVVLGWPNGRLQESWCAAGSTLQTLWVNGIAHQDTAVAIGPDAVRWIADRFADRPAARTCDQPPPLTSPDQVALLTGP